LVEIKETEEEWNQGQLLTGTCPGRFGSDENASAGVCATNQRFHMDTGCHDQVPALDVHPYIP